MTEQEWLECTDPSAMLEFYGKASERKVRLFAVACCRRIWHLLADERSKRAVELTERNADGQLAEEELRTARQAAPCPYPPDEACDADPTCEYKTAYAAAVADAYCRASAACASAYAANPLTAPFALCETRSSFMYWPIATAKSAIDALAGNAVATAIAPLIAGGEFEEANVVAVAIHDACGRVEQQHQCDLIRCIFGNHFRPITLDPSWLTPKVVSVAQTICDQRAFERLPILADALEEAGSTNAEILNHCRSEGPHVRGCWVVDLILGKQ